jgi:[methyl-Co(III) methanol-specific corrinoid protein]:coenzyme M methyltransferase
MIEHECRACVRLPQDPPQGEWHVAESLVSAAIDLSGDQMSGRRRFLSAIFGGRVDRPSCANPSSSVTLDLMEQAEAYFPEVHLDAEKMARLAATAYDVLGYDAIMPIFCGHIETAALGCDVDWGTRTSWPDVRNHPFDDPEAIDIPDDFLDRPSMRAALDAISILRRQYGNKAAIIGKVYGPWNLAYHLHGVQDFLIETIVDPDKVRRYLDRLVQVSLLSGKAQIEAGADAILWCDQATGDLVRRATYCDFLLPIHKEVTRILGCPLILHTCGDTADRLGDFVEAGFDSFHFDSKVDAKYAKGVVGDRMSLIGNVNCPSTMASGTVDEVRRETQWALDAGVEVVGPECVVSLTTPLENLKEIVATAKVATGKRSV